MPVGRPDFWYSQSLVFEQSPTQGKTDAGPTSDWAYTHALNASVHHAKYTDAEARAAAGWTKAGAVVSSAAADKVGVGTAAPATLLALGTAAPVISTDTDDASDTKYVAIAGGGALSNTRAGLIGLYGNESAFGADWVGRVLLRAGNVWTSGTGGAISFQTGAAVEVMTVANSGKVGIGTYAPGEKLSVVGNIAVSGTVDGVDLSAGLYATRGNLTVWDKTLDDWTRDGAWHVWDLSVICPAGARAALIRLSVYSTAGNSTVDFKAADVYDDMTIYRLTTMWASATVEAQALVALDASRQIKYRISAGSWVLISVAVIGWWL